MPKVSFVIPCYNLAHFLPECITSILGQTYDDFEILIMDDCSPDNTPEVAQSFLDPRVIHVRNQVNLGHLQNYNKGIELSKGNYIWLISADDRLRKPYILKKYISLMEEHPEVGYVFCPAIGLINHEETNILDYSCHGHTDRIINGRTLINDSLLRTNSVIAASGMVRKQLYERFGAFPLDLPCTGDWYLWCLFALHSEVGYFAEPMVNYREHQLSISKAFMHEKNQERIADNIALGWHIKRAVEAAGHAWLIGGCEDLITDIYAGALNSHKYGNNSMSIMAFEQSVQAFSRNAEEKRKIITRSCVLAGDFAFTHGEREHSATLYATALRNTTLCHEAFIKYILLRLGFIGDYTRRGIATARQFIGGSS
jgi:glycosyltransferase involved in cell wall biosynthesis